MGLSTNYLGHLNIHPPLNSSEVEWLRAFAAIDRRHYTEQYEVAANPRALTLEVQQQETTSQSSDDNPFTSLAPRDGTPYPHLDWGPCVQGCCLSYTGTEKSRMAEEWLQYLIDHFLRPGAHARSDGRPEFAEFTFDHVVEGIIAGERDDNRELFLIHCENNEIRRETIVAPDPDPWGLGGWPPTGRVRK